MKIEINTGNAAFHVPDGYEVKGIILNNKFLIYRAKYAQNEMALREYLEVLEELKKEFEEK